MLKGSSFSLATEFSILLISPSKMTGLNKRFWGNSATGENLVGEKRCEIRSLVKCWLFVSRWKWTRIWDWSGTNDEVEMEVITSFTSKSNRNSGRDRCDLTWLQEIVQLELNSTCMDHWHQNAVEVLLAYQHSNVTLLCWFDMTLTMLVMMRPSTIHVSKSVSFFFRTNVSQSSLARLDTTSRLQRRDRRVSWRRRWTKINGKIFPHHFQSIRRSMIVEERISSRLKMWGLFENFRGYFFNVWQLKHSSLLKE